MTENTQTNTSTPDRLWDEKEAATFCGFTKRGMEQLRKAKSVPHIVLGRSIRYRPESLRAYLARMERGGL
jgi:hypothetical protein